MKYKVCNQLIEKDDIWNTVIDVLTSEKADNFYLLIEKAHQLY